MEDYPEELRTPPVSLVSIVGCPELHPSISAALSSQQPPMNTLALPDFSKASILARSGKARDPLAPPQAPAGILKKDWLLKHRTRVPAAVAALFRADQVSGDPAQWLQACSDLENLKSAIQGKNTKLVVVLVQAQASDELSEDVTVALRKRAEIDSRHMIVLVEQDETEWSRSLSKLKNVFAELCSAFYKEEGRRIKARIEKRNFSSVELSIRYCFKVAVYAEFRRDWPEALKFYEEGVRVLREMIGTSTRLPPTQRLVEIKAVAEQFHFKISTLLLHAGKVVEAILWQFLVFGELIETSAATVPDTLSPRFGTADNALTEWEFQPAYYYQLAATYLREKRYAIECSSSVANLTTEASGIPESVMPSVYVGQYVRLFEQGDTVSVLPLSDTEYTSYALSEAESRGMAIEYYAAGDFSNAKQLFDGVAGQSGKLECLSVKATINKHLVICCHAESPASMEDFPLWKFEDHVETLPTKDNVLAFSGQKLIQVEEPDAQVDLVLNSAGSALVGEIFIVPVTILSKGHAVHSGELKINLVDAKGGGLLMSPREAEESESHDVELLGVSTVDEIALRFPYVCTQ
nr:unnamed protein product [Digitaria exilis]